jgi:hypothetical protein
MVRGHAHEITLATTWNRPRWNVQCHGTLQSQHEGLSNDLVMYARVSPGKPDIEVWEQANGGAKKLAIVLVRSQPWLSLSYLFSVPIRMIS